MCDITSEGIFPLTLLHHFCFSYTWENHNWEASVGQSGEDANKNAWLYQSDLQIALSPSAPLKDL